MGSGREISTHRFSLEQTSLEWLTAPQFENALDVKYHPRASERRYDGSIQRVAPLTWN